MVESKVSISSAVILPDEVPISPRVPKRRQSTSSDVGSKRPRLSTSGNADSPTTVQASPKIKTESDSRQDATSERRRSHVQEEKKRGQRLFGGLINTLSQSSTSGQQKRRLEIEKRQQEKAKQQKAEDEGRKAEKLARLKTVREREQVKFDEQSMRIRHSNMLALAQFLCTRAEPKLYYKPWELLPGDEARIKQQIAETETLIEREVQEFKARHPDPEEQKPSIPVPAAATGEEGTNSASSPAKETVGEPRTKADESSPSVLPPTTTTTDRIDSTASTNTQVPHRHQSEKDDTNKASLELHNGEVVVEAEEDTVIY